VYGGVPRFQKDMSETLGLAPSNIHVIDYYEGSVIILYNLVESSFNDLSLSQLEQAYNSKITSNLKEFKGVKIISSGQISSGVELAAPQNELEIKSKFPLLAIVSIISTFAVVIVIVLICLRKRNSSINQEEKPAEFTIRIKNG
jgi:hypothetical protein